MDGEDNTLNAAMKAEIDARSPLEIKDGDSQIARDYILVKLATA